MKATEIIKKFVCIVNEQDENNDVCVFAYSAGSLVNISFSSGFTRVSQTYTTEDLEYIDGKYDLDEFARDLVTDCKTALANAECTLEKYKS